MFTFPEYPTNEIISVYHGPKGYLNQPPWCRVDLYRAAKIPRGAWVWRRVKTLYRGPVFDWTMEEKGVWVRMGNLKFCLLLDEDLARMAGLDEDAPRYAIHDRLLEKGLGGLEEYEKETASHNVD